MSIGVEILDSCRTASGGVSGITCTTLVVPPQLASHAPIDAITIMRSQVGVMSFSGKRNDDELSLVVVHKHRVLCKCRSLL